MRDLVVTENITVDGVIDASEGWFTPSGGEDGNAAELAEVQRKHMSGADAVLLGRVTYRSSRLTGRCRPPTRPASRTT